MPIEFVLIGLGVMVLIGFGVPAIMYNNLVRTRNTCQESWSNVDTELKRRHDLIPNLVEVVKGYAKHERDVLDNVTRLRGEAMRGMTQSPAAAAHAENMLAEALGQIRAVAEAYPDLKADKQFQLLARELVMTEDRIQAARRFYNGNVREFNNLCQMFPSAIMAKAFNFSEQEFFELADARERLTPIVNLANQPNA